MGDPTNLEQTPLHAMHVAAGARMVPFAGYEMPVQYPLGVMREHLHTRQKAGLFDVSHMGQVELHPTDGKLETAMRALEALVPVAVLGLKEGRQRYALFTNEEGGILDDLMVANCGDHLFLVVNAACKAADIDHMRRHLGDACDIRIREDRALLALQGPQAEAALAELNPAVADMVFMDVRALTIDGIPALVSRSGYTGEDGFEISVAADEAAALAERLLQNQAVEWIGLGARDSLRLEAGLCLYGNDIDSGTTPIEASLEWAIQKPRRKGGDREGGFPGADLILDQLQNGAPRRRVGLKPEGRAPVRDGVPLFAGAEAGETIGRVTSGGFGPSVDAPVAMGLVPRELSEPGRRLFAEVRGKRLPVTVSPLPFVRQTYKR